MYAMLNASAAEFTDFFLDVSEETFVNHAKDETVTLSTHLISQLIKVESIAFGARSDRGVMQYRTIGSKQLLGGTSKRRITAGINLIVSETGLNEVVIRVDDFVADTQGISVIRSHLR
jgi:hypothetical protein